MKLLLDTNALLWWLAGSDRLGRRARAAIASPGNSVYVSAASAWEIAIKISLGKLAVTADATSWLPVELVANRFTPLPIDLDHALRVEHLPPYHADPFDRILIVQAATERMVIVTGDAQFERYGVRVLRC